VASLGVVSRLFSSDSQTLRSQKLSYRVCGLGLGLAATGDRIVGGLSASSAI
jgi:hypothetical protein